MSTDDSLYFSQRQKLRNPSAVLQWDDAPKQFREALVAMVNRHAVLDARQLHDVICEILGVRSRLDHHSYNEEIWNDIDRLVQNCKWYYVYDIIEAIWAEFVSLVRNRRFPAELPSAFQNIINRTLRDFGIGWQLVNGMIQARGDDAFEAVVTDAKSNLHQAGKTTAESELTEALKDISRRPLADATGAIQHAMAALECVAKDITGDSKATLGQIINKNSTLIPKPLDQAVDKLWGFANDKARHVREGETLDRQEAQLVVGLAASLANDLVQKASLPPSNPARK